MNNAQRRLYAALLVSPPASPNGDAAGVFWKGYAFEATGIGAERTDENIMRGAFEAGREHRRRGGGVPDRVRRELPNLFACLA